VPRANRSNGRGPQETAQRNGFPNVRKAVRQDCRVGRQYKLLDLRSSSDLQKIYLRGKKTTPKKKTKQFLFRFYFIIIIMYSTAENFTYSKTNR